MVQHNCQINHFPELGKKLVHALGRNAARQSTDEELCRVLVFLSWDGSFRVDLRIEREVGLSFSVGEKEERRTYDFAI